MVTPRLYGLATFAPVKRSKCKFNTYTPTIMRQFASISSLLLLSTSVALVVRNWLAPSNISIDLSDEDYHLYL
ncbi:hypothetical protein POKO110462_11340 [Pontibacter korlensis]